MAYVWCGLCGVWPMCGMACVSCGLFVVWPVWAVAGVRLCGVAGWGCGRFRCGKMGAWMLPSSYTVRIRNDKLSFF